jgi:hypothetical protein
MKYNIIDEKDICYTTSGQQPFDLLVNVGESGASCYETSEHK